MYKSNNINKLLQAFEDNEIWDAMPESKLEQVFRKLAIPAFKDFISMLPDELKTIGDGNIDEEIAPLIHILNLLGIKTIACCSGHGKILPNILMSIINMDDFNNIHCVLTDFSGGTLVEYFQDKFILRTIEQGIRIDIDCSEAQLNEYAAWLFFLVCRDYFLQLHWKWKTDRIILFLMEISK